MKRALERPVLMHENGSGPRAAIKETAAEGPMIEVVLNQSASFPLAENPLK
jgi:hypothetical protein